MTISQGLSHWVVLHWHSMKFVNLELIFCKDFLSALLFRVAVAKVPKGSQWRGFEAGKGLSLSAEGSKGCSRRGNDTELGWGIRDRSSEATQRGDSGDSGGVRTEASSLGEWREIARLDRRDHWWSPDPLETEHRLLGHDLSTSDTVHYPPPTARHCPHIARSGPRRIARHPRHCTMGNFDTQVIFGAKMSSFVEVLGLDAVRYGKCLFGFP